MPLCSPAGKFVVLVCWSNSCSFSPICPAPVSKQRRFGARDVSDFCDGIGSVPSSSPSRNVSCELHVQERLDSDCMFGEVANRSDADGVSESVETSHTMGSDGISVIVDEVSVLDDEASVRLEKTLSESDPAAGADKQTREG